jgi:hypothetical protein
MLVSQIIQWFIAVVYSQNAKNIDHDALEGTKILFDALSQKKNLQFLNVSTNKLGDDRAVFVATLLKTNSTLKSLDIRSNAIGQYLGSSL